MQGELFVNEGKCRVVQRNLAFRVGVAHGIDCLLTPPSLGGRCDEHTTIELKVGGPDSTGGPQSPLMVCYEGSVICRLSLFTTEPRDGEMTAFHFLSLPQMSCAACRLPSSKECPSGSKQKVGGSVPFFCAYVGSSWRVQPSASAQSPEPCSNTHTIRTRTT